MYMKFRNAYKLLVQLLFETQELLVTNTIQENFEGSQPIHLAVSGGYTMFIRELGAAIRVIPK